MEVIIWRYINWITTSRGYVLTCGPTCIFLLYNDESMSKSNVNRGVRRRGAVEIASDSWSVDTCQTWVRAPSKAPAVSLSKTLYSHCLVLVGSRNRFERDLHKQIIACFTIELKQISINYNGNRIVKIRLLNPSSCSNY